ncbi:MAG: maltodextrin glucosidase [Burkholderiales bacterium]|nr:maltodextrin glucosidase [Burkholderiales bacterium]
MLLHPPIEPWVRADGDGLTLVLLSQAALPAGSVLVRSLPDNEELLTPMQPDGRDGPLHRWRARIAWDRGNALTRYAFVAAGAGAQGGHAWLGADGLHAQVPPEALHFRVHPHERPPAWVAEQVVYQVFPDRYARGGTPVDRRGETLYGAQRQAVVQAEWGAPIDPHQAANTFYGGDLPGLVQRLPYLHDELGVSALYLNPVFCAASNHRYDTTDYTQVDPHLGGNAALAALRRATRERGMRLVLDAVVNHTGVDHPWFDHWGRHGARSGTPGAAQSPASPWRGHYAFDAAGRPMGWKGHAGLPVLDFASPALRRDIYEADDAVLRRWLREPYAIDGWRLDVVHMLGEGPGALHNARHVRAIRRALRAVNPEAYVLGEHFAEATRWLQGEQEDGAMNYHGFAWPVLGWLAGREIAGRRARLSTPQFVQALQGALAAIPYANQLAQLNLLGSHDTPRVLTALGGDAAAVRLAMTLLFTWPGVPCLYYGDEIGLEGGPDPDCRRCFDWDPARRRTALWAGVQGLVRLRRTRAEWQRGACLALGQGDDWLAYARYRGGDAPAATVAVVNRGTAAEVALPLHRLPLPALRWRDADGTPVRVDGDHLQLALPPRTARVLLGD